MSLWNKYFTAECTAELLCTSSHMKIPENRKICVFDRILECDRTGGSGWMTLIFRARALSNYSHSCCMVSNSLANARQFRAAYLSGRLFTLSASFSKYCENSCCEKWILLCKAGFFVLEISENF